MGKNITNEDVKKLSFLDIDQIIEKLPLLFDLLENKELDQKFILKIIFDIFTEENDLILLPYIKKVLRKNDISIYNKLIVYISKLSRKFLVNLKEEFELLNLIYISKNSVDDFFSPKRYLKIIDNHLPINSYDIEAVEYLINQDKVVLRSYIPDLVFWLYDQNSPIYDKLANLLSNFQEDLINEFNKIFNGTDNTSKYNCLIFMKNFIDKDAIFKVKSILERFVNNPTEGEIEEYVNILAKDLLQEIS